MPNISSVIKAIQDIMRKDTGVDGDAQRLSQIVWMLFLKIFADKEEEAEIMSDDYTSPLEEKYRWQNWAKDDEGMTGDELIDFIKSCSRVFFFVVPTLKFFSWLSPREKSSQKSKQ